MRRSGLDGGGLISQYGEAHRDSVESGKWTNSKDREIVKKDRTE